jgi:hypothetical protein
VTYRVSVLELYVLLEGEVIPKLPRGPANDAPAVDDEVGEGLGEVGVGVVMGGDGYAVNGDAVGVGEAVGKEFSP